ncbi:MAG TPA: hypothetical protein DD400_04445 [Rhodospirillaceae bacterium]|nr:hypothetical protein [Rhodospirillaceae bacterium]
MIDFFFFVIAKAFHINKKGVIPAKAGIQHPKGVQRPIGLLKSFALCALHKQDTGFRPSPE